MELTPELLLEAKFGPARRGYDMAEVDDFLERCAEGLDVLLERLRAEFERAERAEARVRELEAELAATRDATSVEASPFDAVTEADFGLPVEPEPVEPEPVPQPVAEPPPTPAPSVDEPMRILVHAERTAEAAIAEARAEAERIRTEAESVASRQRSEAENMLATAKAEAEEQARRAGEETKRGIQAEVLALRRDRDTLADDIRGLRRWLDEQRTRMRSTARELQRLVEDPSALQYLPVPELSEVSLAEPAADAAEPSPPEEAAPSGTGNGSADAPESADPAATQAVPVFVEDDDAPDAADDPWTGPQR